MRKLLFFLLLLPALASLGHDAYVFYEEQDKGFRLSDLGALWDKHHKESHDQWKTKVQEISHSVNELVPENVIPQDININEIIPEKIENMLPEGLLPEREEATPEQPVEEVAVVVEEVVDETIKQPTNDFTEGFSQSIDRDGNTKVEALETTEEETIGDRTRIVISAIGFLLEQKAVFVLGAIPLFFFLLNALFAGLFKEKEGMDKIRGVKKTKRKGGGYKYSRK